jgi:hypothetical protein
MVRTGWPKRVHRGRQLTSTLPAAQRAAHQASRYSRRANRPRPLSGELQQCQSEKTGQEPPGRRQASLSDVPFRAQTCAIGVQRRLSSACRLSGRRSLGTGRLGPSASGTSGAINQSIFGILVPWSQPAI